MINPLHPRVRLTDARVNLAVAAVRLTRDSASRRAQAEYDACAAREQRLSERCLRDGLL